MEMIIGPSCGTGGSNVQIKRQGLDCGATAGSQNGGSYWSEQLGLTQAAQVVSTNNQGQ